MKRLIRRAGIALTVVLVTMLASVPVFADAVAPGPLDMLGYRLAEFLPVILIALGVLGIATAVILIVVFRNRKKKQTGQEKNN